MKKKLISVVSLMLAGLFALSGCNEKHSHNLTKVDRKDATCIFDGHEEYYECSECHKLYSDAEGKHEIQAPTTIQAFGHHYVNNICEHCGRPTTVDKSALNTAIHDAAKTFSKPEYYYGEAEEIPASSSTVNITAAGVYSFEGEYETGISVAKDLGLVVLYLNNVEIRNDGAHGISCGKGTDLVIELITSSSNSIKVTSKHDGINAGANLYIVGEGTLDITSSLKNGVNATGNVFVNKARVNVDAKNNGLSGNGVSIFSATLIVFGTEKDGIKSEAKNYSLNEGFVYIDNSDIDISTQGDGIQTDTFVYVKNSGVNIVTTGEFVIDSQENRDEYGLKDKDFAFEPLGTDYVKVASDLLKPEVTYYALTQSCKGIKSGGLKDNDGNIIPAPYFIYFEDSNVDVNSFDDAVNCKAGNVYVKSGIFELTSKDDGLTCDVMNVIEVGTFTINSFEGIEGQYIEIYNGEFTLNTRDDSINASSDNDEDNRYIYIENGQIDIHCLLGDAIDSNTRLLIKGGKFNIDTGTEEILDSELGTYVDGGSILGLAYIQLPDRCWNRLQKIPTIHLKKSFEKGQIVSVYKGETKLLERAAYYAGGSIVIADERIALGDNINVLINGVSVTVTINAIYTEVN